MQGITTAMITELSKVTTSDVQGEFICLQAMFPHYADREELDSLII